MKNDDFSTLICNHEPKYITPIGAANKNIGEVKYFCADRGGAANFKGEAVINFTGTPNIPQILNIPELAEHIDDSYEEVVIAWPDYGFPKVKPTFWKALHKYLSSKNWKRVCLHCAGGHGRTGTAISALLIAVERWRVQHAVRYVRKNYCWRAVETAIQCDYLCTLDEELNGRKIKESEIPESSSVIAARKSKEETDENLDRIINAHFDQIKK